MVAEFKIDWARAIEDAAIEYAEAYVELQCDADNDHQREHLKALKDLRETIKRGLEVAAAQPERKPMTRDEIRAEWDKFIEYPSESRLHVTTTSALLFAEHIAQKCIKDTP